MRNLLLSSVTLLLVPAVSFAAPDFLTHIHTPIELKSISQIDKAYKTAAICFLGNGDCGEGGFNKGDDNMSVDTAQQCKDDGYSFTTCSLPSYLSGQCPYNDAYYARCVEDKQRACKDAGYVATACPDGETANAYCPYDNLYKTCKCTPCSGYDYTYAQATAQGFQIGASCNSCGTIKYQRQNATCSGFQTCECGGEIGASSCYSGFDKKYSSCKNCCMNMCNLNNCPANRYCGFESCSGKYCDYGKCGVGWIYYNDGTCNEPEAHTGSKTALGVVIYSTGNHGQVMAPKYISSANWANINAEDCSLSGFPSVIRSGDTDYNSCSNTDKILTGKMLCYAPGVLGFGGNATLVPKQDFQAAWAARNYAPTPETAGKWCLPAISVFNQARHFSSSFAKIGGMVTIGDAWSSSLDGPWETAWSSGRYESKSYFKNRPLQVWPVFEY